ncbi:MAG: nuclear transport factor 2 family protein [SAR202 cluster bacterium]|nr:nuclear transport factor 2 family protein [SAR202 cluster bacterium]
MVTDPTSVVASYLASFETGDPETIAAHVSDGFENVHTSALGSSCHGRSAYRDRLPAFLSMFEGVRYEPVETTTEGNRVAVAYMLHATHGDVAVQIPGMFRFTVDDGLITRRVDYFDSLTFLRQTGQA